MRLKAWVKVVLVTLPIIILLAGIIKLDENFMKNCTKAGHSIEYCESGRR